MRVGGKEVSENPSRYNELKFMFFGSLESTKGVCKGDVRAFMGVETWLHERERLDAGESKYAAHTYALEKALEELKQVAKEGKFSEVFSKRRKEWLENGIPLPRRGGGQPTLSLPIPEMKKWGRDGLKLISLFSGALGLDIGFLAAGFDLKFANDIDENSQKTVAENLPDVPFLLEDFTDIKPKEVLEEAGLDVGEVDVLTGGPPCQPFSTAGKRRGLNDPRASPLKSFIKAVKEIKPKTFVMEEVTGLQSARLKHVPISERDGQLKPEERKGSAFKVVLKMLNSTGYNITYDSLNAADYGSPQGRDRLIFVGLKEGEPGLPHPTHSSAPKTKLDVGRLEPWNTFWDATADLTGDSAEFTDLSAEREKYMRLVPPGGYWRHLPKHLIREAMGGAYESGGGKMGYFRRLSWDYPSPTVVTSPSQKGTMLGHPEETRPLSVQEYRRIQGFPDDWTLVGSARDKYKLIGDAVPVHLSYAVAKKVKELLTQ